MNVTPMILFETGQRWPRVSVVTPLYNYANYIEGALNSVRSQTLAEVGLVVIDDCSKDSSASVAVRWLRENAKRFAKAAVLQNRVNSGLAASRNIGIEATQSDYVFLLDADNLLYPRCLMRHLDVLETNSEAVAAFSLLEVFDGEKGLMGAEAFNRERLKYGNYIDAMAMFRRSILQRLKGYRKFEIQGWEDYDLWLRLCEMGEYVIHIPEILSRYRVHARSMLRTETNVAKNQIALKAAITRLHPWLEL